MSRILTIRKNGAPKNHSKYCELVICENDKTLDLVLEGKLAEYALKNILRQAKEQFNTYGYNAAKEYLEYEAKYGYRSWAKITLYENETLIAEPIKVIENGVA